MAVASAGPYASLHLAPDRQPRQHPTTRFFTGRMPFLPPNQQRQSTEGTLYKTDMPNKLSISCPLDYGIIFLHISLKHNIVLLVQLVLMLMIGF